MSQHNPKTNPAHAERMIASLDCQAEVMGYYGAAKARGLAPHELRFLSARKNDLIRRNKWRD